MRLMPRHLRPAWVPFVWAALAFTLLLGALNGASNLWLLHVVGRAVPIEHHQAHALAQLFGFMWLLTMGVSLHLAPRLFGGQLPAEEWVRRLSWTSIGGVALVSAGRLGSLLPFSGGLGFVGAGLILVSMGLWLHFVATLYRERQVRGDFLPHFVLAGTVWWTLAGALLLGWQFGQVTGTTPLGLVFQRIPFSAVTASALYGGSACWVFGITLRAGACTMRIDRALPTRQRVAFFSWQVGAVALVLHGVLPSAAAGPVFSFVGGLSMLVVVLVVQPWRRPHEGLPDEPWVRLAMVGAWSFAFLSSLLLMVKGVALFGAPLPARFDDVTRHAFTLGFAQLAVFGFAGRMLPSFEGISLPSRALYDVGIVTLLAAAGLRLAGLGAPHRLAAVASGLSGPLALIAVSLVGWCFARALWLGRRARRERETLNPLLSIRVESRA
jgi:hypothetical protein